MRGENITVTPRYPRQELLTAAFHRGKLTECVIESVFLYTAKIIKNKLFLSFSTAYEVLKVYYLAL